MTDDREYPNRVGEKAMHDTVIKIAEVSYQTGLSRATIYREIKAGNFPKQLQLSPQRVGWLQWEIDAWKSARRRGPIVKTDRHQPKALQKALNNDDQSQFPKLVSA
jgi:prophage regulatory protein